VVVQTETGVLAGFGEMWGLKSRSVLDGCLSFAARSVLGRPAPNSCDKVPREWRNTVVACQRSKVLSLLRLCSPSIPEMISITSYSFSI
jgi:hypothetical protein